MSSVHYQRVALIGLGLIGSSLAHVIRREKLSPVITGYAKSAETRATSPDSRALSEYAGLLAGEMGLDADRVERLRLAAYVYGTADDGVQARVAAGALDGESAEWILADSRPAEGRPLETRILHTANAFVRAGGHTSQAGAGRALAGLFQAGDKIDADCLRALERLLAA